MLKKIEAYRRFSEKSKKIFALLELAIQVCVPLLCVMLFAIFWTESGYAFIALIPPFILVWWNFFSYRMAIKKPIIKKTWADNLQKILLGGKITFVLTLIVSIALVYAFSVNLMYLERGTIVLLCLAPMLYVYFFRFNIAKHTDEGTVARTVFSATLIAILYAIFALFTEQIGANQEVVKYYEYRMSKSEWLEYYSAFIQLGIFIKTNMLELLKGYSLPAFATTFFVLNVINVFSMVFGIIFMTDRLLDRVKDEKPQVENNQDTKSKQIEKLHRWIRGLIVFVLVGVIGVLTNENIRGNINRDQNKSKFTMEKIQKIFGITQDSLKKLQDELNREKGTVENLNRSIEEQRKEIEKLRLENAKIKTAKKNACIDPVADFLKTSQLEEELEDEDKVDEANTDAIKANETNSKPHEESVSKQATEENKKSVEHTLGINSVKEQAEEIKKQAEQGIEKSKEMIDEGIEEVKNRGMWEAVKAWFSGLF